MIDQLTQALKEKHVPEEKISQYVDDISKLILGYVYVDMASRLTPDEDKQFAELLQARNFEGIMALVKTKYGDEEFAKLLEEKISPVMDDYISQVLDR